jgi:hypothetical protein
MKKEINVKPGEVIMDYPFQILMRATNVFPPYTEDELAQLLKHDYALVMFFQESGLLNKNFINRIEDVKNVIIKESDFTNEGLEFYFYVVYKKGDMKNFWVDPEKRVNRVFVKALEKMRAEKN